MSLAQAVRVGQAGILSVAVLFIVVRGLAPLSARTPTYLIPRSVVIGGGFATIICHDRPPLHPPRALRDHAQERNEATERVLLVGAGQAADMLIREIQRTPSLNIKVVGLVDDNPRSAEHDHPGLPGTGLRRRRPRVGRRSSR